MARCFGFPDRELIELRARRSPTRAFFLFFFGGRRKEKELYYGASRLSETVRASDSRVHTGSRCVVRAAGCPTAPTSREVLGNRGRESTRNFDSAAIGTAARVEGEFREHAATRKSLPLTRLAQLFSRASRWDAEIAHGASYRATRPRGRAGERLSSPESFSFSNSSVKTPSHQQRGRRALRKGRISDLRCDGAWRRVKKKDNPNIHKNTKEESNLSKFSETVERSPWMPRKFLEGRSQVPKPTGRSKMFASLALLPSVPQIFSPFFTSRRLSPSFPSSSSFLSLSTSSISTDPPPRPFCKRIPLASLSSGVEPTSTHSPSAPYRERWPPPFALESISN